MEAGWGLAIMRQRVVLSQVRGWAHDVPGPGLSIQLVLNTCPSMVDVVY